MSASSREKRNSSLSDSEGQDWKLGRDLDVKRARIYEFQIFQFCEKVLRNEFLCAKKSELDSRNIPRLLFPRHALILHNRSRAAKTSESGN